MWFQLEIYCPLQNKFDCISTPYIHTKESTDPLGSGVLALHARDVENLEQDPRQPQGLSVWTKVQVMIHLAHQRFSVHAHLGMLRC